PAGARLSEIVLQELRIDAVAEATVRARREPPLAVLEEPLGAQIDSFGTNERVALDPSKYRQQHRHAGLAEHLAHVVEEQIPHVEVKRRARAACDQAAEKTGEQPRAGGNNDVVALTAHLAQYAS